MLDGFSQASGAVFFERRRLAALVVAALLLLGSAIVVVVNERPEKTVTVELAPDIKDFAVDEKQDEEPEPEEAADEPPPPPPPNAKVKRVKEPTPRVEIAPPDEKVTDAAEESAQEKVVEVAEGPTAPGGLGTTPGAGKPGGKPGGTGTADRPVEAPKPKPPKPKVQIDPTKPIDRPANATPPIPLEGNAAPEYPESLRDEGVTGRYVVKLHIHRDGAVKGMKIIGKKNTATGDEAQAKADKLFLNAIVRAVKTWKYKPSTLEGKPISVWHSTTIPFTLKL